MPSTIETLLSSDTQVGALTREISKYRYNAAGIQRVVLTNLREILNNEYDIVDATSPFVMLMESSCVNTAAFMVENFANNRKQYPAVAQTVDDLYLHMSDKDYIDRFATPATTRFSLLINKAELLAKMVLDPSTGIRKVTIPRHSEFIVAGVIFSLQYPIDIKQLSHGGLEVVYDVTVTSPLQTLTTNTVDKEERTLSSNNEEVLYLEFDVSQFFITSVKGDLNSATGYNKSIAFRDDFYYARVFFKTGTTGSVWKEMYTTHSDQVYDPKTPTALLKVGTGELQVTVPQIYFTSGLVGGSIRVDIYQTKGALNMTLDNYKPSSFEANWKTIDDAEANVYVSALRNINSIFAYSTQPIASGKAALTFEQLRQRVIQNTIGALDQPITGVQITTALQNKGYEIVRNVDTATKRVFFATKPLPKPLDTKLITEAAASIETLIVTMQQASAHALAKRSSFANRVILTPDIVYRNENGVISMVEAATIDSLKAGPVDELTKSVNANNYLYSPFHYVLDATDTVFDVRAYYLSLPQALSSTFVNQNDTTQLQVNTYRYNFIKVNDGYRLLVETKSNEAYRNLDDSMVHVQLAFKPANEELMCYLSGTLAGKTNAGERVFEFALRTNFDVDSSDNIWIDSFSMLVQNPRAFASALKNDFTIHYSTSALMGSTWQAHAIDSDLGKFQLPNRIAAITQEKIRLLFGSRLQNLWTSNRSIPSTSPLKTYDADVYQIYNEDVYEADPVTGSIFHFDINGEIAYNTLIAKKGDQVINPATGLPVIKHRKGDVILDLNGLPIATGENMVGRQIDMFFVEGSYYFATDVASSNYREYIVSTVVDWVTNDLVKIDKVLLEQTDIYFYPKTSMGNIRVVIENGTQAVIEAGQSLSVKLYVSEEVFKNAALRTALTENTIRILDTELKKTTVAVSTMTASLRSAYGDDVVGFQVTGLGGIRNIQMFTILEGSDRCSIRKRLTALPDGKLIVQEAIDVEFVSHQDSTT